MWLLLYGILEVQGHTDNNVGLRNWAEYVEDVVTVPVLVDSSDSEVEE